MRPFAHYLEKNGTTVAQLASTAGLDAKLVKAIADGNFTPGPDQRRRLAAALAVSIDDISWGHAVEVQYLRGNGPQCGRPT